MSNRKRWMQEEKTRRAEKRRLNRLERIEHKRATREKKKLTKHHNIARSLGGNMSHHNIFMLSSKHHEAYHALFGLRTFAESAALLLRMEQLHDSYVE